MTRILILHLKWSWRNLAMQEVVSGCSSLVHGTDSSRYFNWVCSTERRWAVLQFFTLTPWDALPNDFTLLGTYICSRTMNAQKLEMSRVNKWHLVCCGLKVNYLLICYCKFLTCKIRQIGQWDNRQTKMKLVSEVSMQVFSPCFSLYMNTRMWSTSDLVLFSVYTHPVFILNEC